MLRTSRSNSLGHSSLLRRAVVLAVAVCGLSSVASAYYNWVFYTARTGPFTAVPVKFDLAKVPDATVSFFVPQTGPAKLADGDNYSALVSQIRRAAESWNVSEAGIKLRFGGYSTTSVTDAIATESTPGIDVVFEGEMPPGVLALTEPLINTDLSYLGQKPPAGQSAPTFIPIVRSRLKLAADLSASKQPSYSDAFFATLVHEFGHTMGLQHSMTAGAMTTSFNRNTSKAAPLTADDVAGLAHLYPTQDFVAATGSIAGHVSAAGQDANLASVVALRVSVTTEKTDSGDVQHVNFDGTAIGAMTQPDGSYRIDGLPPGDYIVYAHPLPAPLVGEVDPAGIVPPRDLTYKNFNATTGFQTRFFPNTKNWQEATHIHVSASAVTAKTDFSLAALSGFGLSNLRVWTWMGPQSLPVLAPPLPSKFRYWTFLSASGAQLLSDNTTLVPGLKIEALSDAAVFDASGDWRLQSFPNAPLFMLAGITVGTPTQPAPVAVALSSDQDLVVLPRGFSVQPTAHPLVTKVDKVLGQDGIGRGVITGQNLTASTRVFLDGAEASGVTANDDGTLTVLPPPAVSDYAANVTAISPGGQSSSQIISAAPLRYFYDSTLDPWYRLTPSGVTAGTDVMVTVDAGNVNFLVGNTAVGFGTSDIVVRQMWVVSPSQLLLNLSIKPGATLGLVPVTISTGLQQITGGIPLQIRPAAAGQRTLYTPILSDATGLAGAPAGATIVLRTSQVPDDARGWAVRLGNVIAGVSKGDDGLLRAEVPAGTPAGPLAVELLPASGSGIPPVLMQVDPPAPEILALAGPLAADGKTPQALQRGDLITLRMSDLSSDGSVPAPATVEVRIGGVRQLVDSIAAVDVPKGTQPLFDVQFHIATITAYGQNQPVFLRMGTRQSNSVTLTLNDPNPPAAQ